jgi:hypothetical protein
MRATELSYDEFQGNPRNSETKSEFLFDCLTNFDRYLNECDPNSIEFEEALDVLPRLIRLRCGSVQLCVPRSQI